MFSQEPWRSSAWKVSVCGTHLTFTSIMQVDLLPSSVNKLLTPEVLSIYRLDRLTKGFLTPLHRDNERTLFTHLSNQESHSGQYLWVKHSVSTYNIVSNSLIDKLIVSLSFYKSILLSTLWVPGVQETSPGQSPESTTWLRLNYYLYWVISFPKPHSLSPEQPTDQPWNWPTITQSDRSSDTTAEAISRIYWNQLCLYRVRLFHLLNVDSVASPEINQAPFPCSGNSEFPRTDDTFA